MATRPTLPPRDLWQTRPSRHSRLREADRPGGGGHVHSKWLSNSYYVASRAGTNREQPNRAAKSQQLNNCPRKQSGPAFWVARDSLKPESISLITANSAMTTIGPTCKKIQVTSFVRKNVYNKCHPLSGMRADKDDCWRDQLATAEHCCSNNQNARLHPIVIAPQRRPQEEPALRAPD